MNKSASRTRSWLRGFTVAGLLLGGLGAAPLSAQTFITGTVVDWMGNPVAGVDIDAVDDSTNNDANLSNDGTDAAGFFLTEFLDGPAQYDITFNPPGGAELLPAEVNNQFVIGTVNLGTIVLPLGYILSGKVVNPANVGIQGVDLNVLDSANGNDVTPDKDKTDVAGNFSFNLAPGTYDVQVDPAPSGFLLAPTQRFAVALNSSVNLGNIKLKDGLLLSGTIRNAGGAALAGVDIDVVDVATGELLYTPGDNSDATGFVDVVVAAGTYDVEIEPAKSLRLVAEVVAGVAVSGNTSFGTVNLQDGWQLSGRVKDGAGSPLFDADVDAFDPVSGAEIHLPGSHTDSGGNYLVVLPVGTSEVHYIPVITAPQRGLTVSTSMAGDRTQDVTLTNCPTPGHYGSGNPGTGGFQPQVDSVGDLPRLGVSNFQIRISQGIGGGRALLLVGFSKLNVQGNGWTLLVNPFLRFNLPLSGPSGVAGAGQITLSSALPDDPSLDGLHLYLQVWVPDAGAIGNLATSTGLDVELCQ